jgi:hypothetical protein
MVMAGPTVVVLFPRLERFRIDGEYQVELRKALA